MDVDKLVELDVNEVVGAIVERLELLELDDEEPGVKLVDTVDELNPGELGEVELALKEELEVV